MTHQKKVGLDRFGRSVGRLTGAKWQLTLSCASCRCGLGVVNVAVHVAEGSNEVVNRLVSMEQVSSGESQLGLEAV